MKTVILTPRRLAAFRARLWKEEKNRATVEKYLRLLDAARCQCTPFLLY